MPVESRFEFEVGAEPQVAFSWIEDLEGLPAWDDPVKRVVHVPGTPDRGVGAQFLADTRVGPLKLSVLLTVTGHEPRAALKLTAEERRMSEVTEWTVRPAPNGTTVTLRTEHRFRGVLKPMEWLLPVIGRPVQRRATRRLAGLMLDRQKRMFPAGVGG